MIDQCHTYTQLTSKHQMSMAAVLFRVPNMSCETIKSKVFFSLIYSSLDDFELMLLLFKPGQTPQMGRSTIS